MALTRSEAVQRRARLMNDDTWRARWIAGDAAAAAELSEIVHGLVGTEHGPDGKPTWTSGALSAEELAVKP